MELLNDFMGRREFMTYLEKEFSGKEARQVCVCVLAERVEGVDNEQQTTEGRDAGLTFPTSLFSLCVSKRRTCVSGRPVRT